MDPSKVGRGVTKAGTPRKRAERTYYGVARDGTLLRFVNFEDRARALRNEEITRPVSQSEARKMELRQGKLSVPASVFEDGKADPRNTAKVDRRLVECYTLLGTAMTLMTQVKQILWEISEQANRQEK